MQNKRGGQKNKGNHRTSHTPQRASQSHSHHSNSHSHSSHSQSTQSHSSKSQFDNSQNRPLHGQSPNSSYRPNDDDRHHGAISPNSVFMQVDQEEKPKKKIRYNYEPREKVSFRKSITSWGTPSSAGALKFFLGYLSTIAVLGLMIGLMVYHFAKKDLNLPSVSGGLDYIALNLNSDPVIELIAGTPACPTGYETIHLGRWPGTERGCNCPIMGLKRGSCTRSEDRTCTDVSDNDEIDMFNFEGSNWCAKRAQLNVDYVKAVTCSSDYQQCSPGICMRKSLSCPITYVTIEPTGDDPSKRLKSEKYITVTREQGKSPLIDIDISLNSLPCFSLNEIPKGGGDYFLLKRRPDGCGTYGVDTFSAEIARTTEDQVFTFNNFPTTVLNLPKYREVFQITPTILAARKRITVANNQLCLSLDTSVIKDASDAADTLNRYMSGTAITAMVIHGLLFLTMCGALFSLRKNYSWGEIIRGQGSGSWLCGYIPLGLMDLMVFIVMTALVVSARKTMDKSKNYLISLDKAGCFPSGPPKNVIGDYDDLVDQTATKLNVFAIVLLSITGISYIIIVGIIIYKKKCASY